MLTAINQQAHKLLPMKLAFLQTYIGFGFCSLWILYKKAVWFLSYVQFHLLLAKLFVDLSNLRVLV